MSEEFNSWVCQCADEPVRRNPQLGIADNWPTWGQSFHSDLACDDYPDIEFKLEPEYPFEVYTTPYDGVVVEAKTGIPASEYISFENIKI